MVLGPIYSLTSEDYAMNDTTAKPDFVPLPARPMTVGELAANFESEKPERGNLRISFKFLRFQPTGILRSVRQTAPGRIELNVSLNPLHSRWYVFAEGTANTPTVQCWVWTPAEESAAAAVATAAA